MYWLCFFHVLYKKENHYYYHHVIIKCDINELDNIDNENYIYVLKEYKSLNITKEELKDNLIIKSLIRDGESILKVLRTKAVNKNKSLQK